MEQFTERVQMVMKALLEDNVPPHGNLRETIIKKFTQSSYSEIISDLDLALNAFFQNNPDITDEEEAIEEMCQGEESEVAEQFGGLEGYSRLDQIINEIFHLL